MKTFNQALSVVSNMTRLFAEVRGKRVSVTMIDEAIAKAKILMPECFENGEEESIFNEMVRRNVKCA